MKLKMIFAAVVGAYALNSGLAMGALALVVEKDAHTKLPEAQRGLYVEKEGRFHLDVDGIEDTSGLKSALEKERKNAKDEAKARKDLAALYEGIDPVEYKKMMDKLGGDEEAQLIKAGKIDEVVARRTEKLRKELEKKVEAAQKDADAQKGRASKFSMRVLDNHIRAAATKAGLHANAVEDALFRARTMFSLNEDGDPVQLDKDNHPVMGKDGKTPFGPGEWLESMKETAPHWFPANASGSGASGGAGGAGAKVIKRAAFEALGATDRAAKIKEGFKVID